MNISIPIIPVTIKIIYSMTITFASSVRRILFLQPVVKIINFLPIEVFTTSSNSKMTQLLGIFEKKAGLFLSDR
jgi:hypothetical protein